MECNIIRDLIPLYIDNCCSAESKKAVDEHIENCPECRKIYDEMNEPIDHESEPEFKTKLDKINSFKASIMQSVLLFASFFVITVGVAIEASIGNQGYDGLFNGHWAFSLVVPATGFMLSLVNWYFVRQYKSRKTFSNCSLAFTVLFTLIAYVWTAFHYGFCPLMISVFGSGAVYWNIGIIFSAVLFVLSKKLSDKYAKMVGKE